MKKLPLVGILLVVLLSLSGCAASSAHKTELTASQKTDCKTLFPLLNEAHIFAFGLGTPSAPTMAQFDKNVSLWQGRLDAAQNAIHDTHLTKYVSQYISLFRDEAAVARRTEAELLTTPPPTSDSSADPGSVDVKIVGGPLNDAARFCQVLPIGEATPKY